MVLRNFDLLWQKLWYHTNNDRPMGKNITCIHLDGIMRGSVFRWILLPLMFRRCPLQPPDVRRLGWSSPSPEPLCTSSITGLPFVCSSSPQPQRCCFCLSAQTPYQLPLVCSCNSYNSQCSPHCMSSKTSASHFRSKEPDLPSILLTVLHQLLILQVFPLILLKLPYRKLWNFWFTMEKLWY